MDDHDGGLWSASPVGQQDRQIEPIDAAVGQPIQPRPTGLSFSPPIPCRAQPAGRNSRGTANTRRLRGLARRNPDQVQVACPAGRCPRAWSPAARNQGGAFASTAIQSRVAGGPVINTNDVNTRQRAAKRIATSFSCLKRARCSRPRHPLSGGISQPTRVRRPGVGLRPDAGVGDRPTRQAPEPPNRPGWAQSQRSRRTTPSHPD